MNRLLVPLVLGIVLLSAEPAQTNPKQTQGKEPTESKDWKEYNATWATLHLPGKWSEGDSCGPTSSKPCDSSMLAYSEWKGLGGERVSLIVDLSVGIGGSAIWTFKKMGEALRVEKAPEPRRCVLDEVGEEVDCDPAKYMIVGSAELDGHWLTFIYTGSERSPKAYARCRALIEGIRPKLYKLPKAE